MNLKKEALRLHRINKGKITSKSKVSVKTKEDLSLVYTPGVAEVCKEIAAKKDSVYEYTMKANSVVVVTDGSAIVILAALMNATKVVNKRIENLKVVINGAGAAGIAVTKLLLCFGIDKKICTSVREIVLCDSKGIIYDGRANLNKFKTQLAKVTNMSRRRGTLKDALYGADAFIGVSVGNLLKAEDLKTMNKDAIVFAMANPIPEIMPNEARKVAIVVGTGRSDFPNQINNSLAFPGVFRGTLDAKAIKINNEMKIAAAHALANCVNPTKNNILPYTLDKQVVPKVAEAVRKAVIETGVVR